MENTDVEQILRSYQTSDQRIDKAISAGVVGAISETTEDKNFTLLSGPMGRVVCDRLYRMQYLTKKQLLRFENVVYKKIEGLQQPPNPMPEKNWFEAFHKAVSQLQDEAQLIQDNWFGSKTFKAVQQLFAFEEPTLLDDWFSKPESDVFLNRAIYVRLRANGILPGEEERFFETDAPFAEQARTLKKRVYFGVALWHKIMQQWGTAIPSVSSHKALVIELFDVDKITHQLAARIDDLSESMKDVRLEGDWESQTYTQINQVEPDQYPPLGLRVLMSHARVEAWLNGYGSKASNISEGGEFNPGDSLRYSRYARAFQYTRTRISSRFNDFSKIRFAPELRRFERFWKDTSKFWEASPDEARAQLGEFKPLYKSKGSIQRGIYHGKLTLARIALYSIKCASVLDQLPAPDKAEQMDRLNEEYKGLSVKNRSVKVWKRQSGGFVANVLDGIKRAVKWFWGKVKSIFRKISDFALRIIKVASSLATRGFAYFKRLVKVVSEGISVVTDRVWVDKPGVKVVRDTDFDVAILVQTGTIEEEVTQSLQIVARKVMFFRAACVILEVLLRVFWAVINLVGGVNKWKIVDAVIALANFSENLSEEDKGYLDQAFAGI